jgi:hypothetical protein
MLSIDESTIKNLIVRDVLTDYKNIHIYSFLLESSLILEEIKKPLILINADYDLSFDLVSAKMDSTITMQIEKFLNWITHRNINIPHPNEIRNYLLQHYDILRFLPLVCKLAKEQFGPSHQISLEIYHDPEILDEYLTLYVRAQSYDESFIQKLEDLLPEYQSYLSDSTGWFLVMTDYQPPI